MELKIEDSRIVLLDQDVEIGEITWKREGDVLAVDHTFVNPDYRGQRLAHRLLEACAEMARAKHLKLKAVCPFVVRAFEQSTDYDDVKVA